MKKKTIAVDVDDVIASHAEALIEFSNQRWGTNLTINDYDEHWAKMWRVDQLELEKRAQEFFKDFPSFKRFPDALEVLKALANKYKLVILTSRRQELAKDTKEWLNKYYPNIFSEIHYSGIWDNEQEHSNKKIKATKGELVKQIGADYLIDDQPKHCVAAAEAGVRALLFGDYSWQVVEKLPAGVVRVKDWPAVLEYFDAQNR